MLTAREARERAYIRNIVKAYEIGHIVSSIEHLSSYCGEFELEIFEGYRAFFSWDDVNKYKEGLEKLGYKVEIGTYVNDGRRGDGKTYRKFIVSWGEEKYMLTNCVEGTTWRI